MGRKNFKREVGQAMVEFALVLPVFLILLGGIIDFGWVFGNKLVAANASREAARYASIHANDSSYANYLAFVTDVIDQTKNRVPDSIKPDNKINVNVEKVNGNTAMRVAVTWSANTFMPFYSKLVNPINIESETIMRIE